MRSTNNMLVWFEDYLTFLPPPPTTTTIATDYFQSTDYLWTFKEAKDNNEDDQLLHLAPRNLFIGWQLLELLYLVPGTFSLDNSCQNYCNSSQNLMGQQLLHLVWDPFHLMAAVASVNPWEMKFVRVFYSSLLSIKTFFISFFKDLYSYHIVYWWNGLKMFYCNWMGGGIFIQNLSI